MIPVYADKPVDAAGEPRHLVIGKDQPEYLPLPAWVDQQGTITTVWEFTAEELDIIMKGGRLRLTQLYTKILEGELYSPIKMELVP